ncbi:MAG: hypothetical protein ACXWG4_12200, partial [Thermoanaerobaculia bacterium]
ERHRGRVLQTVAQKNRARRQILRTSTASPTAPCATLRPRITADAGIIAFAQALRERGLAVPASLHRRHRSGIEALLRFAVSKPLDDRSLRILEAVLSEEPSLAGRVGFAPL